MLSFESVYKMYVLLEKRVEELFLYVSPVSKHFSINILYEHLPRASVHVVHVSPCETELYDVLTVVAHKMQLESVTSSMVPLPLFAIPANTLLEFLLTLWHTGIMVLSTYIMPVHLPKAYNFMNSIISTNDLGISSTKRL